MGAPGIWTEEATASTDFAPMFVGAPKVSPVPAQATTLRVEVVSRPAGDTSAPLEAQVDTSVGGFSVDRGDHDTPYASTVHLDERPSGLTVTASVASGQGTIQCRIYADELLVAVATSTKEVTCTPTF